ncbi:hypothetical protein HBB16_09810, partial [Pseudonocardia sp. MCCB 268]|nr:hypothetical protein [Pseudonocardia cytotoxica]
MKQDVVVVVAHPVDVVADQQVTGLQVLSRTPRPHDLDPGRHGAEEDRQAVGGAVDSVRSRRLTLAIRS